MIKIHKKSDTVIIVIHEIYGINQHMKDIYQSLSKSGFDVVCPNLLEREIHFEYAQEEEAYQNFMGNVGFRMASKKIKNLILELKDTYNKIFIVGYSVGATIAWLCSEEKWIDGIVGYYGSRIRNYAELSPQCPIMLFFPQEEKSFDLKEFIPTLKKKNLEVYQFQGKHGFSDPYSPNYNDKSAHTAYHKMVDFFRIHS